MENQTYNKTEDIEILSPKVRVVLTIWTVAYVVDKLLEADTCQFFFLDT